MKKMIRSAASLMVGIGVGCFIGYQYSESHTTNEAVEQMVHGLESSDAAEAARNVRAIEAISVGDTRQAVELLSSPIADYYSLYAEDGTRQKRSEVRRLIERVSRTNEILASRIAEGSTNQLR